MRSLSRKGDVSAAAAAADGHAGGDANGWNPNNMECQPLNSTIACSPVACSPVACSPVACSAVACSPVARSPVACSPLRRVLPLGSRTLRVPFPNSRTLDYES